MRNEGLRAGRGFALALALMIGGVVGATAGSGILLAQSDVPAAACGSGPNVICPAADDPSSPYIASVTAVHDGVVILLTDAGLEKARECDGPETIARMSAMLYALIPDEDKADYRLDWNSPALADEIYGHAFFNKMSGELGGLGSVYERSNPIDIVFADYGGPGEMTAGARVEQTVFAGLGAAHRAAC